MHIGTIQQVLHSEYHLLDGDGWSPSLFLIQNAQTDCSGWVNVWTIGAECGMGWKSYEVSIVVGLNATTHEQTHKMKHPAMSYSLKQGRDEFTLGRLGGVLLRELHSDLVDTASPVGTLLAWNAGFPSHQIHGSVGFGDWTGPESKRVVASPVLSFFF